MVYSKTVIDVADSQVGYLEKKSNKDKNNFLKLANNG